MINKTIKKNTEQINSIKIHLHAKKRNNYSFIHGYNFLSGTENPYLSRNKTSETNNKYK